MNSISLGKIIVETKRENTFDSIYVAFINTLYVNNFLVKHTFCGVFDE
jgi:hypothetical protein